MISDFNKQARAQKRADLKIMYLQMLAIRILKFRSCSSEGLYELY